MHLNQSNIVLIGMAGCGKSTIGRMLAKNLSMGFIDTDNMIVAASKKPLQEIINTEGPKGFRYIEESILTAIHVQNHVIATGGSSVYSQKGMMHLKENGTVVLLEVELSVLEGRVSDVLTRGLVKRPDQSFRDLYYERIPLYGALADLRFTCGMMSVEKICTSLIQELSDR